MKRFCAVSALMLSACLLSFDDLGPQPCEGSCSEGGSGGENVGASPPIGGNGGQPPQDGGGGNGTGASTSDGGGGSNPDGGGGTGGAPPTTVMVECGPVAAPIQVEIPVDSLFICWYIEENDHPAGVTLQIAGTIDSPNDPDLGYANPLPGCVATSSAERNVFCDVGPREDGTDAILELRAIGADQYILCDQFDIPNAKCPGEVRIYRGDQLLGYFKDPPVAPWSYRNQISGEFLQLRFTDAP